MLLSGVEIIYADTWLKRLVGLLAHNSLPRDQGMFFRPGGSIHTIGMRFPIDVIYLDAGNKVLKIVDSMKPFRFSFAPKGTCAVLELTAGYAKHTQINLETTLVFD